jgi:hypothetical protein
MDTKTEPASGRLRPELSRMVRGGRRGKRFTGVGRNEVRWSSASPSLAGVAKGGRRGGLSAVVMGARDEGGSLPDSCASLPSLCVLCELSVL